MEYRTEHKRNIRQSEGLGWSGRRAGVIMWEALHRGHWAPGGREQREVLFRNRLKVKRVKLISKYHRGCPSTDEWIKKSWCIYNVEYYLAIKRNPFNSVLIRWRNLEPIIQNEICQKEKDKHFILMHIYGI